MPRSSPRPAAGPWLCAVLAASAGALPAKDQVESLPGWDAPLFSKTYAGYIDAGEEDGRAMHEHYLFFESEGDPSKDPVIMWTNGGPGASSFFGSFSELGPYYLTDASAKTPAYRASGVPTLFENKWRWTKLGSLLIRNLPPPIGYSYCDPVGPSGDGYSCGSWNDTKTAKHSHLFMKNWFAAFPEFATRDLFLVGESYAGIYVPTLARAIMADPDLAPRLKGFAVGDGCLGGSPGCVPSNGPYSAVEFYHGHGQFSDKTYAEIRGACPSDELVNGVTTPACKAALDKMDLEKGYSFEYNLYDECYDFDLSSARAWHEEKRYWGPVLQGPRQRVAAAEGEGEAWHMDGSPCGGTGMLLEWVKTPAVKKALHVAADAHFFTGDNGVGFTYNVTEPELTFWYREALTRRGSPRVLIYNGDTDPSLNSFYAQNWTSAVGLLEVEPWRPWTRDGKTVMGGYVTRYAHNFDFLTIRGSGHMVPQYKPEAAFVMLRSFVRGEDYPRYSPPSGRPSAASARGEEPDALIV